MISYLGNIRRSRFSVSFFSSCNSSVLTATRLSRLLAYFSIMANMLSKMFDLLQNTESNAGKRTFFPYENTSCVLNVRLWKFVFNVQKLYSTPRGTILLFSTSGHCNSLGDVGGGDLKTLCSMVEKEDTVWKKRNAYTSISSLFRL